MTDHTKAAPSAQQAAGSIDTEELHFNAQRLRNVAELAGCAILLEVDDFDVDSSRGAYLGIIARKLRERAATPAQPIAPAADCLHDDTVRQGAIWTACQQCGKRWADDEVAQPIADVSAPTDERNRLYMAAIACGHQITDGEVRLFADSRKEGNALSQLADRLAIAARAAAPVSGPTDAATLEASEELLNADGESRTYKWLTDAAKGASVPEVAHAARTMMAYYCGAEFPAAPVSGQGASIGDDAELDRLLRCVEKGVPHSRRDLFAYIDSRPRSEDSRAEAVGKIGCDGVELFEHHDRLPIGSKIYLEPPKGEDSRAKVRSFTHYPDGVMVENEPNVELQIQAGFNNGMDLVQRFERCRAKVLEEAAQACFNRSKNYQTSIMNAGDARELHSLVKTLQGEANACMLAIRALASTTPQKADNE